MSSERKPLLDDDLVEWLRHAPRIDWDSETLNEAADEIDRLRAEIADLKDEQRALNQGAAHNANIDRSEIEFWKAKAHEIEP